MTQRRVKISVSLPADLVAGVDREARAGALSRSRVLESWLRRAARSEAHRQLEQATIAYYESLTPEERAEDAALSAALSKAARRLRIDGAGPRRSRPRRR